MARVRLNITGRTANFDIATLQSTLAGTVTPANTDIATSKADAIAASDSTTNTVLATVQTDMTAVGAATTAIVGTDDCIVDVNTAVITNIDQLKARLAIVVQRFREMGFK
jgi:hypothetical protein